ncbi:MAG: DNA adenine methylase [Anaerolineae bacterium]|nr:Dam family site-specific DNA-(adenine-N6)-methyltransferase [Anaerolineales bacterium]MCQ3976102.1 DNA adenine methylase [Anaerolineae bacterium]
MAYILLVPPIKCQGIKTKLVPEIKNLVNDIDFDRWIEPFCGSCVVALNIQPKKALLADTNVHIIQFYKDIQNRSISPGGVKEFLIEQGQQLKTKGETYYYEIRERFNLSPNSYDFLFLNRACFNGVMRFNRKGYFNVPFCRKPDRFSPAYVTKIVNQIRTIATVIHASDWVFEAMDFQKSLSQVKSNDMVYADPPYMGRHVDYFNSWSESHENCLVASLQNLSCKFILSTWHSNEFRRNPLIDKNWNSNGFHLFTKEHFYHVGSHEDLRHAMLEALITNFALEVSLPAQPEYAQLRLLELPFNEYKVNPTS